MKRGQRKPEEDVTRVLLPESRKEYKARLCLSYRLLVWFVLSLGSTLSFMARSSQAAVFTCRRLGLAERARMQNVTSAPPRPTSGFDIQNEARPLGSALLGDFRSGSGSSAATNDFLPLDDAMAALWSQEAEDWIVATVSIGYYLIQLPASILSMRVGAGRVCVLSAILCVVTSYLSVPAMAWGVWPSAVVCLVKGASAGALYPAVTSVASRWCGRTETSMLTCFVESGIQVGNAAAFLAVALLCKQGSGWEKVFYAQAGFGVVFTLCYCLTVDASPASHSCGLALVPDRERRYLVRNMEERGFSTDQGGIPYKAILKSWPVWAIVVAELSTEWLDCLMATSMPQFLGTGLGIEEKLVEWVTFAFFLLPIPLSIVSASVVEWLLGRDVISLTNMRKICNIIGQGAPALCYLLLPFLPKDGENTVAMATTLYVVSGALYGLTDCAWLSNVYDLAPRYTGFVFSLGEMLTAWSWSLCVVLVGYMAPQDTREQWQKVMYLSAALILCCIAFYTVFASAEQQPWAGDSDRGDVRDRGSHSRSRRRRGSRAVAETNVDEEGCAQNTSDSEFERLVVARGKTVAARRTSQ